MNYNKVGKDIAKLRKDCFSLEESVDNIALSFQLA